MGLTKELMHESMRRGHQSRDRYVCGKCLNDEALANFVKENAIASKCDFCGESHDPSFTASLGDVIEHMAECMAAEYTNAANEVPWEMREGGWQGDALSGWDLLEEVGFYCDSEELFKEIASAFSDQEWCLADYFNLNPSERLQYGWETFKKAVKHARRFTFWSMDDDKSEFDSNHMPVGTMLATIGDCIRETALVKTIPNGTKLWRVRVHDPNITFSEDHQLSPPPVEKAIRANRMSPAGVVMFYGAEDFETAYAETVDKLAGTGKRVTGGTFHMLRDMRLLDLFELPQMPSFFQPGSSDYRSTLVFLRHFARDMAIPVARDGREHIDYVPTQAFTEYVRFELRLQGGLPIDGIRYRSAVNGRPCYVLFCAQEDCVANPSAHRLRQRWFEFDPTSIRSGDAEEVAMFAGAGAAL